MSGFVKKLTHSSSILSMEPKDKAKQLLRSFAAQVVHFTGVRHMLGRKADAPWRILMYHRVSNPEESQYPLQPGMYVTPSTFAMQMKFLAEEANVISLDQLADVAVSKDDLPPRSVAVTFDDGWADIYRHAFPVLKEYNIPATLFLPTSFIGTSEWFWADKMALAVTAIREEKQYVQTVCARVRECADMEEAMCSQITQLLTFEEENLLQNALDDYVEALKLIDYKQRLCVVNTLLKLAKEFTSVKLERAFLNWDEVREMAEQGLAFGSHSHLHQNFTELSQAQISDEIENSFQVLRSKDITPSPVFCYPQGKYNDTSQEALAEKKIRFALTTRKDSDLDSQPILLGRIGVHEDISDSIPLFTSRIWVESVF